MHNSFVELAEKDGFKDGWRDAWQNLPCRPQPDIGWGMFDLDYRRAYQAAYRDGHATGKDELMRQQKLMRQRDQPEHQMDRERD